MHSRQNHSILRKAPFPTQAYKAWRRFGHGIPPSFGLIGHAFCFPLMNEARPMPSISEHIFIMLHIMLLIGFYGSGSMRDRRGQKIGGSCHPQSIAAQKGPHAIPELRSLARDIGRERTIRPYKRCLYRGRPGPCREIRTRRRRHPVSG
jgi:hypothetical protein